MTQIRIHKFLAQAGVASRREAEKLLRAGRITVDGELAIIGQKIDPDAVQIRIDGRSINGIEENVYIALHKPPGVLSSTRSQGGHNTVLDLVGVEERVYPVGRLDLESEGLIILTNDGEFTHRLTHPRYGHEKEYLVQLGQRPTEGILSKWRNGPTLASGEKLAPVQIQRVQDEAGAVWLQLIMKEGRKRQIRRTAEHLGHEVLKLIRIRIGDIELGSLQQGEWRFLKKDEIISGQSSR